MTCCIIDEDEIVISTQQSPLIESHEIVFMNIRVLFRHKWSLLVSPFFLKPFGGFRQFWESVGGHSRIYVAAYG